MKAFFKGIPVESTHLLNVLDTDNDASKKNSRSAHIFLVT